MPSKTSAPEALQLDPRYLTTATNPNAWRLTDLKHVPPAISRWTGERVRVASTFSGGGGSSMGYKRAGCWVTAANDIDESQAWHYRANLSALGTEHPTKLFTCPIRELFADGTVPPEYRDLDILDGSPPCTTFSMLGNRESDWGVAKKFREGQVTQVLSDLFFDFLDLVAVARPRTVIAENVKGMLVGNAKGYVRAIDARLRALGYRPQIFLINAAHCGVPQSRERVFITAVREDLLTAEIQQRCPYNDCAGLQPEQHCGMCKLTGKPRLSLGPLLLQPNLPVVQPLQAIADIVLTDEERAEVAPRPDDLRWWHRCRWGEPYDKMKKRLGILPATNFNAMRCHPFIPVKTLSTSAHMFTHWSECRRFAARELARFGAFPDDYLFQSKKDAIYIIGMSVPPKMTEQVARAVCAQWLGVQYAPSTSHDSRASSSRAAASGAAPSALQVP